MKTPSNFLKYITEMKRERSFFQGRVEELEKYIEPGKYRVSNIGKKMAFKNGKIEKDFILNNIRQMIRNEDEKTRIFLSTRIKILVGSLFTVKIKSFNKKIYNGSLIMKSHTGDVIIFDFKNRIVIRFFCCQADYLKLKNAHSTFFEYFKAPWISFCDDKLFGVEKYIMFRPSGSWSLAEKVKAIEIYLENYYKYLEKNNEASVRCETIFGKIKALEIDFGEVDSLSILNKLKYSSWPNTKGHGDLNFNNILLSEGEYYFIDWELYGDYMLLYDFFNLIFIEAIDHGEYDLVKCYLEGLYDEQLSKIFKLMSLEFCREQKKSYLALYIVERILKYEKDRVKAVTSLELIIKPYIDLLNVIED